MPTAIISKVGERMIMRDARSDPVTMKPSLVSAMGGPLRPARRLEKD
jgi:hypothetical protein